MEEESDVVPNECGTRVVDGGVDRISQLPDEILLVILSFLRLREAAATTVLSSRWSDLWKHTPNLKFDKYILPSHFDFVFECDDDDDDSWEAERCKYIETVNSVIQSHKALSLKNFGISLKVKKSDKCAVTKWLKFVLSRQVESLELDFEPYYDYSYAVVLEESLREEGVISGAPETLIFFQSLRRLSLKWLKVSGEDIELFLRNCPLLEQLIIEDGFLTSDVQLCGANLRLKHLDIFCKGARVKSVKVSAPNLTRINFSESAGTLSFENVPKLVEARFKLKGSLIAIQHFSPAASYYLYQLQSLELLLSRPKVFWMSGFPKMPNLKKLVIFNYETYQHSLLPITALIWASPRLEEIKIKFYSGLKDTSAWMEGLTNVERSLHQHLKVFAFQMSCRRPYVGVSDHIVELVTYILDNCVALQKIIIGSPLFSGLKQQITAEMQADADNLTQQLQAKVLNHIQLELPYSI